MEFDNHPQGKTAINNSIHTNCSITLNSPSNSLPKQPVWTDCST